MYFETGAVCLLGMMSLGHIVSGHVVSGAHYLWGRLSPGAGCLWGWLSLGRIVSGADCLRAYCLWDTLSLGRIVLGQIVSGQIVSGQIVSGQITPGRIVSGHHVPPPGFPLRGDTFLWKSFPPLVRSVPPYKSLPWRFFFAVQVIKLSTIAWFMENSYSCNIARCL